MRIYRKRRFPAILFFLILVVAILVFRPGWLTGIKNLAFGLLSGPFRVFSGIRRGFENRLALKEENLDLKQRVASLSVELARMKETEAENERLRSLLKFRNFRRYKGVIASVVARDSSDWQKSIIINRGRIHGIARHSPCATEKGLVGSVVEVWPTTSKVMLITDPSSRVGVILAESRESGVLVGSQQGMCRVLYLSLDKDIKEKERVLTAGFGEFFPKGIPVGSLRRVAVDSTNLYKYAIIEPYENLNALEEVICLESESRK